MDKDVADSIELIHFVKKIIPAYGMYLWCLLYSLSFLAGLLFNVLSDNIGHGRARSAEGEGLRPRDEPVGGGEHGLDTAHDEEDEASDNAGGDKEGLLREVREAEGNNDVAQEREGAKDGEGEEHDQTLLHAVALVAILWHLQLELLGHHDIDKEFRVLCHLVYDHLCVLLIHPALNVDVNHLLNLDEQTQRGK